MFIIAANWKMNGDVAFAHNFAKKLPASNHEIIILPPAPLLGLIKGNFKLGGQNCYMAEKGAFTGEISPNLLKDIGCEYVLLGHSERRHNIDLGAEQSDLISFKAAAAHKAGLKTIICGGEKSGEDFTKMTFAQLEISIPATATATNTIIAYEPVWAIGTGRVASAADAQEVCAAIRSTLAELASPEIAATVRVLYGGSVNAKNVGELVGKPDVDGALVGGASLDGEQFATLSAIAAGGPLP